jgi:glycosyltransferase involved in cell wall biosynthesis
MSAERDIYTLSLLHAPVQRDGGAQVYTGTLAKDLQERGQLRSLVSPYTPRNDFQLLDTHRIQFDPLPLKDGEKDWARYSTPSHIDFLANQVREGLLVNGEQPNNIILYSQYVTAFPAGIQAIGSLHTPIPHIAMGHTWQDSSILVGTGSVQDILRAYLHGEANRTARDYIPERRIAEEIALQQIPWFIIPTEQERKIISILYASGGLSQEEIYDKFIVVPLGVEQRFHDIGTTVKNHKLEMRERIRITAKESILAHLKISGRNDDARKLEQLPDDALIYYTVGRWKEGKGIENALKAYVEMFAQVDSINSDDAAKLAMLFCGPFNPNEAVYKQFVEILKDIGDPELQRKISESIILTNSMDGYYAAALGHVFVGPSDNESCYLVLQEAMAAGNAVVATDYPTIRDTSRFDMRSITGDPEFDSRHAPQLIDPRNTTQFALALDKYRNKEDRLGNGERNAWAALEYTVRRSTDTLLAQLRQKGIIH